MLAWKLSECDACRLVENCASGERPEEAWEFLEVEKAIVGVEAAFVSAVGLAARVDAIGESIEIWVFAELPEES